MQMRLGRVGLGWVTYVRTYVHTYVRRLGWIGLDLVGLGWVGLSWIGLDWFGLGWIGLDWVVLGWMMGGLGLDWA